MYQVYQANNFYLEVKEGFRVGVEHSCIIDTLVLKIALKEVVIIVIYVDVVDFIDIKVFPFT